ncbi:uncharacterized protein [Coffea arabica]|uniref:UBN2 domain-containing protein n=1 Tax=Coffea arabica TaxID=13443 RepID=A0ABM4X4Y3_COFAR
MAQDLDLCLRIDEPGQPTLESSEVERALYENWERSNLLSLMIIKSKIAKHIRKSIPESTRAREFLALVGQQFSATDKALAGTLMATLTTKRYDGVSDVREHIMEKNNLAKQLKTMDMTISESFLVQFILNPLPPQFGPFKITYNTQKDKWTMNELISMCVQEEERLKREGLQTVHLVSQGHFGKRPRKNKRKS